MEFWQGAVLIAAMIATGLMAGLFFAFSCAIMPGLRRTDERTFVGAFQGIDRAIINPLFVAVFMGAPVFAALAVVVHLGADERSVLLWTIAAVILNLATVAITRAVHLPLNAAIQAAGAPDQVTDLEAVRTAFEARWVRWNVVRTVTSTAAFGCLAVALAL